MARGRVSKLDEQLAEFKKLKGFDDIPLKERRKRIRKLLDQETSDVEQYSDLTVLMFMSLGMTEQQARDETILRGRQHKAITKHRLR